VFPDFDPSGQDERVLGRDPGHFAETIIREILSLSFFDGLQNETRSISFGLSSASPMSRPAMTGSKARGDWLRRRHHSDISGVPVTRENKKPR
jgi:hypothetical protein